MSLVQERKVVGMKAIECYEDHPTHILFVMWI